MAITNTIDDLKAADIDGLVAAEASESTTLEFKSAPYAPDHDGSREFLKDTTAFANTAGGLILIGIKEKDGIAVGLAPIALANADKIKLRLESLLQTAVEPRIFGIGLRTIAVAGGCVLAILVPRSAAPPHRVTAKGSNRFYLRSSAGVYEASMDELRNLFQQAGAMRDRIETFRDRRLSVLAANRGPIPLAQGDDKLVLHIVPMASQGSALAVDLRKTKDVQGAFRPLGASGWDFCFNVEGYLASRGGSACHGYTQLFRNGIVEATYVGIVSGAESDPLLSARSIADSLTNFVPHYIENLREVGASPPFYVMVSLVGVTGARVVFDARGMWSGEPQRVVDDLLLPPSVIENFGSASAYVAALKPTLDALWNAGDQVEWTPPTP